MHPLLQRSADQRLGVFTSREAVAAGYSIDDIRTALRVRRWTRLRKGVYTESARLAASTEVDRHLMAGIAVLISLAPGPVLSHASAARRHELLVPASAGADVRVTAVDQWRAGRGYRVARAQLPNADVVPWIAPFATTSAPRTLIDCGREWSLLDTVIALDAALHEGRVLRSDLLKAVHAARHRAGASRAARAVGLSDGRAESPLETEGRLALLAAGLPPPELQVDLHDAHGFVARLDAWYEEAALAIEFDGRVKYRDPYRGRSPHDVLWEEKRREDRVRRLDVRMLRLTKADLGGAWPRTVADLTRMLGQPYPGPRRFTVVRRPEPGSGLDAA
ncbi:type IV toxin-antitoxin system AbiEi family antitoxin domain-containing protein [Blastococcus sp. VKM Ac-2987]|uniref:type IV toxin-antitoxin system AbiEi family antitoxin domain-containing protein n=1 Tax=Blastococcus sp. VKM Ac-2987 TaxID=3004141 RepID=UPI0022ABBFB0|nr:type IV toxin-antitoxin system AbiEi family antitoxin domain-containing protein [Blastococcus sp. VKM Ac-2987]MCZ2857643.1 type IV toxin-antitoxin system AbiEi family antitoxin domain-containing protein [Blastococcus sp. VKM Ac-2987]